MVLLFATALGCIMPVLVNVAFVTLLERKILGYAQLRIGPSKVSFIGLFQPVSDAIKLFSKARPSLLKGNLTFYYGAPAGALLLMLTLWLSAPLASSKGFGMNSLFLLSFMSLGVYPLFLAGWASNSKYAHLGALRGVAQTVSYEISMALALFAILANSGSLYLTPYVSLPATSLLVLTPALLLWLISCVAETNRTPFDFSEGESELVSGFNIEYGGALFAVIFMAEYGMILFLSAITATLASQVSFSTCSLEALTVVLAAFWLLLRATFPRYRYDKLLNLAWKSLLPSALGMSLFYPSLLSISG